MKKNNWLKALSGACLAAFFVTEAQALPAPLPDANFFVKLEKTGRPSPAGGGGVSEFKVLNYANSDGSVISADGLFGPKQDSLIYATCIEKDEYVQGTSWYAVFTGLFGSPSATGGINYPEEDTISRVLGGEFGENFNKPGNSGFDSADVKALQAMLWEAGETTGNDLEDGVSGESVGNNSDTANDLATTWAANYATGDLPALTLYSLINVDWDRDNQKFVLDGNGQDFLTYLPGGGPNIPVPAPILLTGIGLLGLYRFSRKRA
ncbi:MAG: hypothetical protein WBN02_17485 [Sedimenticolaceae bacterium]